MTRDPTPFPPPLPDQPRLLGDRYEVLEVVGEGASAITWRGHDRRLDRTVAIKILRRGGEQDAAWAARFEREARTAAAISHANVVHVYDVGQEDGWLYLVMQFIDGEDLKALIRRRGRLPASEAVGVARQILQGLGAIHRAGILHRDIKPQNVLIDGDGVARLTDFGIAQAAVDAGLTTAGTTVGTAAYMAPEQAQAGTLSEATDLYAVGVVLYEMLTGRLPYERATAMATMLAHIQETPVAPSRRAPEAGIPPMVDGIVLQAMAREPRDRFRTSTAMLRALDGNLADPGDTITIASAPAEHTRAGAAASVRSQAWPATPRPSAPARPAQTVAEPGLGRGLLTAVLVLLVLAMAAVAGYLAFEATRGDGTPEDPAPTNPVLVVIDEPTDEPVIAPPTEEPLPTDEPTREPAAEPTPRPTLEPSPEPTLEPTDEPTRVPIEPAETAVPVETIAPIIEPD